MAARESYPPAHFNPFFSRIATQPSSPHSSDRSAPLSGRRSLVGITDRAWYDFLLGQPGIGEIAYREPIEILQRRR